jgi:hypothetical protein
MAGAIKVKNLQALQQAFVRAGSKAPQFAAKALFEEAQEAFALSQGVVPVRTGALMSSGEVSGPRVSGSRAYCEITYGGPATPYAMFVHELPPSRARHDAPTRWKYLENPVRLYAQDMGARMTIRVFDMIAKEFEIGS